VSFHERRVGVLRDFALISTMSVYAHSKRNWSIHAGRSQLAHSIVLVTTG